MSSENHLSGGPRFHHPFHEDPRDGNDERNLEEDGSSPPKTLAELRMCRLSAHIRQKPCWWEKMRDETICKKWIQEAKEQQADRPHYEQLTDNMIKYVMGELEGYAKMRDPETGIEWGPYERIFVSDTLISQDILNSLKEAIKPLEQVPDSEKDWHPGSEQRVLDLVHPSMYPLVYDETWGTDENGHVKTFQPPDEDELEVSAIFVSQRFQWLPSDFTVDANGTVKLKSSYINNILPEHHGALVPVIERVMERAIPMWERVLSSLREEPLPDRVQSGGGGAGFSCIWPSGTEPYAEDSEEEREQNADWDEWMQKRLIREPLTLPEVPTEYEDALQESREVRLKGSTIQVIVKLANIVLTPEKPEYPGGIWHVEGMAAESIVSTFIYYYESDNIQPCNLNFRMATHAPEPHQQDDNECMRILYGMRRDQACVQEIGSLETKADRCVAFPNIYQHQVSPFKLADPTRPGVRKILVFFLVDPTIKIISASNVPPQQLDVVKNNLHKLRSEPESRLSLLPVELVDYILNLIPGLRTRKDAETLRDELMEERSILIQDVNENYFEREFNMCEH